MCICIHTGTMNQHERRDPLPFLVQSLRIAHEALGTGEEPPEQREAEEDDNGYELNKRCIRAVKSLLSRLFGG